MENKLTDRELKDKLTGPLIEFGLEPTKAKRLAYETVQAAKRRLSSKKRSVPAILIEDGFRAKGVIKIRIKNSCKKDPKIILENFLEGKKGYPAFENMLLELEFGGLGALNKVYVAKLKPKPKPERKDKGESILSKVHAMSPEEMRELITKLQAVVHTE